jgi:hypothetical protein
MNAILAVIVISITPVVGLWVLHLFAFIAEYQENPVIELVEELRKKYSNTNEN